MFSCTCVTKKKLLVTALYYRQSYLTQQNYHSFDSTHHRLKDECAHVFIAFEAAKNM